MDQITKLLLAIEDVDNIMDLTGDNEWKTYIYGHLHSIRVELERQLDLLNG
jgi:hypothetical protein